MDFDLPEQAHAVREGVLGIGKRYDTAYWDACDRDHRWPTEVWEELGAGGWLGLCVPEEYGGGGQGLLELAVAAEALAESGAGGAASFIYLLTPGFGAVTVSRHGTAEQRAELLPGLAAGAIETCFALTEPDAGSDSLSIRTTARRDGTDLVVSGAKHWISGVERARWMLMVCRTTPASAGTGAGGRSNGLSVLLVDVPEAVAAQTLSYAPIPKMGTNTVASHSVYLDEVRVPAHRVLGEIDAGSRVLWDILNPERILAAGSAVGAATLALTLAPRTRSACPAATERRRLSCHV